MVVQVVEREREIERSKKECSAPFNRPTCNFPTFQHLKRCENQTKPQNHVTVYISVGYKPYSFLILIRGLSTLTQLCNIVDGDGTYSFRTVI